MTKGCTQLHCGCGGVDVLWKELLSVTPFTLSVNNDRICAVEVLLINSLVTKLVIFNVYAPSFDEDLASKFGA